MSPEQAELEAMLVRLRALRDLHPWSTDREVRQAYNAAADRLDVLCSKVYESQRPQRPPVIQLRGFWARVWNR